MVKATFLSMTLSFLAILILFSCQQFGKRSMEKGGKTSMTLLCEPQDVSIEEIIYYPNLSLKLNFVLSPKLMMTDTGLCQHARMLINYIL